METKTKEVSELTVLTPEQIEALPKTTKENVVFLTEKMGAKDLMVLNPAVEELIEIREMGSKLKMIKADKDGNFNDDNIREFIDIKNKIRTFRAGIKATAKDLKTDPAKITKALIAIEKTFVNEATIVYDAAEKEFDDYIKAEAEEKRLKEEAKNKALTDKIKENEDAQKEMATKMEKTNVYNHIKYEVIYKQIVEYSNEAVVNSNSEKLNQMITDYKGYHYDEAISGVDDSILDLEVRTELREYFAKSRTIAISLIENRLLAIKTERDNLVLETKQEIKEVPVIHKVAETPPPVTASVPAPPSDNNIKYDIEPFKPDSLNDKEFIDHIAEESRKTLELIQVRIKSNPACSPLIYELRNMYSNLV